MKSYGTGTNDHSEWDAEERAFAAAWRSQPKWVVSRSLKPVGPNARLLRESAIRVLKTEREGEPRTVVLGHGKPIRRVPAAAPPSER